MHSEEHPSIATHFAQYLYSPFAQSNSALSFIVDTLFSLSLSEFPNYFSSASPIHWEDEWLRPFRSLSIIEFMSVVIDRINSFPNPIIVLNSHITEDALCDEVGDEWMGHFASTHKDESNSTSFTLSSQKSPSQTQSVLFYSNSKSLLSLISSLFSFSDIRVVQSLISAIENHSIAPASFTQYCVFLAILAGVVEKTPIQASESDVLELVSSLAEIRSLPSCIVYPFIASYYSAPFRSLQRITQFLLIRCFPLALKSPLWSKDPLLLQIRRYAQYLFGELPSPESPSEFRDLTLNVVVEWFEVLARRGRIEKSGVERMYQRMKPNDRLCRDVGEYALTHFSAIDDAVQPFYLAFFEQLVKAEMPKARELFFAAHACNKSANLLLILCALDLPTLRRLLDAQSATRFLEAVLCQEGACLHRRREAACRCLQCLGEAQSSGQFRSGASSQSADSKMETEGEKAAMGSNEKVKAGMDVRELKALKTGIKEAEVLTIGMREEAEASTAMESTKAKASTATTSSSSAAPTAPTEAAPPPSEDAEELQRVRALVLQLHSKLLQVLRSLFPDKASRAHPLFERLHSLFPSL